tara:strand:- start:49 stop:174 length:126 start_codon:yes stop_codon:yes gene_type:complete
MSEGIGFFKKVWYIVQIVVLTVLMFFRAIGEGILHWVRNRK